MHDIYSCFVWWQRSLSLLVYWIWSIVTHSKLSTQYAGSFGSWGLTCTCYVYIHRHHRGDAHAAKSLNWKFINSRRRDRVYISRQKNKSLESIESTPEIISLSNSSVQCLERRKFCTHDDYGICLQSFESIGVYRGKRHALDSLLCSALLNLNRPLPLSSLVFATVGIS